MNRLIIGNKQPLYFINNKIKFMPIQLEIISIISSIKCFSIINLLI